MGNRTSRRARSENDVDLEKVRKFASKLEYHKTMYLRGENQPETKELAFQYRDFLKNQSDTLEDLARQKPQWAMYAEAIKARITGLGFAQLARFYFHFSWLDLNFNYTATPNVIMNQNGGPRTVVVLGTSKPDETSPLTSPNSGFVDEPRIGEDKKFLQIMESIEKECLHADLFVHDLIKTFDGLLNARYRSELREHALSSFNGEETLISLQKRIVRDVEIFLNFLNGLLQNLFDRLVKNNSIPGRVLSAHFRRCVERIVFDNCFRIRSLVHTVLGLASQREETALAEVYMSMREVRPEDFDVDSRFQLPNLSKPYSKLIDFIRGLGADEKNGKTFSTIDELNKLYEIKELIEEEVDRYYEEENPPESSAEDRRIMTDELLDILVYVLVSAGNVRLLTHLNFIEAFLPKKLSVKSSSTYFMSALKTGLDYLAGIKYEVADRISKRSQLRISCASAS